MSEPVAIGIDFGGTFLRAGLVGRQGLVSRFLKTSSRATEGESGPVEAIDAAVQELVAFAGGSVAGVGIGSPGVIDPTTGSQVGETPHLPHWSDFPLRDRLGERLALPIVVDNDANLAALGEHRVGAARGARVSITVTVGTGVGCGIVMDGRVLHGAWGGAGEIGHLPLGDGEITCRCGVERCVEPEASGSGVRRIALARALPFPEATAVFAAAVGGDREAGYLVDRLCDRLGAAVATAVNLINPEIVVVGGGLMEAGDLLLPRLLAAVNRYALASHRRGLRLVKAALGERAGVVGAGLAAWEACG